MLILDTNVLLNAGLSTAPQHLITRNWLTKLAGSNEVLGVPMVAIMGFVRIATNPRVFPKPLTADQALATIEAWLGHPAFTITEPTPRHLTIFASLLRSSGAAGNLTTDAHIAALAIEYGAGVASFDRDLARFDVQVIVPGH